MATRSPTIDSWAEHKFGFLTNQEREEIEFALMRMCTTSPYNVARNITGLSTGGSLVDLGMHPQNEFAPKDPVAYHYACVAISMIDSGFVCLGSHVNSLRQYGEGEASIDYALRLVALIPAKRAQTFIEASHQEMA